MFKYLFLTYFIWLTTITRLVKIILTDFLSQIDPSTQLYFSKKPPPLLMHLTALPLTHQAAFFTMSVSRAATSLLMLASNSSKVVGRGEYTLVFKKGHRKMSQGLWSGERAGQSLPLTGFLLTTLSPNCLSK